MKLHSDIINKDFDEKVDIVEEYFEEILTKSEFLPNQKINKWKLVMKLHSDIINKNFDEKVDIIEEILEEILPKLEFLQLL